MVFVLGASGCWSGLAPDTTKTFTVEAFHLDPRLPPLQVVQAAGPYTLHPDTAAARGTVVLPRITWGERSAPFEIAAPSGRLIVRYSETGVRPPGGDEVYDMGSPDPRRHPRFLILVREFGAVRIHALLPAVHPFLPHQQGAADFSLYYVGGTPDTLESLNTRPFGLIGYQLTRAGTTPADVDTLLGGRPKLLYGQDPGDYTFVASELPPLRARSARVTVGPDEHCTVLVYRGPVGSFEIRFLVEKVPPDA